MMSVKCQPFYLNLNVLRKIGWGEMTKSEYDHKATISYSTTGSYHSLPIMNGNKNQIHINDIIY